MHYNMRSINKYTNVFQLYELVNQLQFCLASLRTSSCDFLIVLCKNRQPYNSGAVNAASPYTAIAAYGT